MGIPLFSVIVPLYNKEKYIVNTINCVLSQTVQDFEIVVVDDGSTDNSVSLVREFKDDRIHLITQPHSGVAATRNHCIRESVGKYVAFLDADDYWTNDFLEVCLKLFEEYPEVKMVSPSYNVSYGNRVKTPDFRSVVSEGTCIVRDFYEMATGAFWTCNSSCMAVLRQHIIEQDIWYPEGETVYEDFDFTLRLGMSCKAAYSSKICATYNRETDTNARKDHVDKIVYSHSFMNTLDGLLESGDLTDKQKAWVKEIKDRRMVPYIFSLFRTGRRTEGGSALKNWKPCSAYRKYKVGLNFIRFMPAAMFKAIYIIRLKIF